MSYDLRIAVRVEGFDKYVDIDYPERDSPTYNLGTMFRKCTGWQFVQGEYYKCSDVIDKINHGITELRTNPSKYEQYEPDNGWGTIHTAVVALESLRDCIYQNAESRVPIEFLYVAW